MGGYNGYIFILSLLDCVALKKKVVFGVGGGDWEPFISSIGLMCGSKKSRLCTDISFYLFCDDVWL